MMLYQTVIDCSAPFSWHSLLSQHSLCSAALFQLHLLNRCQTLITVYPLLSMTDASSPPVVSAISTPSAYVISHKNYSLTTKTTARRTTALTLINIADSITIEYVSIFLSATIKEFDSNIFRIFEANGSTDALLRWKQGSSNATETIDTSSARSLLMELRTYGQDSYRGFIILYSGMSVSIIIIS